MPARDDAGSNYGRPGGSQNSGVNNGGVAGGMGGGFGGGGAGRMGGIGSRTGLTTGNTMFGGMAFGRPGGFALNSSAFGVRPQAGIARGPLSGARPRPAAVAGVNPLPENIPALEDVPMPTFEDPMAMYTTLKPLKTPSVQGWLPGWPGTGQWWGNQSPYQNNPGLNPARAPNPLANDATSFIKRDGAPLKIGGMQGGMGMPGYTNPGVPGFGGRR
jgi:hypothetical protein